MVKMNDEETKKMLFFQQATGAATRDCIDDEERLIFVVAEGEVGAAVGKGGRNIDMLEKLLKRKILVVEYNDDVEKFTENIFFPTKITVSKSGNKVIINVDQKNRKYIVGKGGYKIRLARKLLKRHFDIDEIKINELRN
jgi:N utilization substance protein A